MEMLPAILMLTVFVTIECALPVNDVKKEFYFLQNNFLFEYGQDDCTDKKQITHCQVMYNNITTKHVNHKTSALRCFFPFLAKEWLLIAINHGIVDKSYKKHLDENDLFGCIFRAELTPTNSLSDQERECTKECQKFSSPYYPKSLPEKINERYVVPRYCYCMLKSNFRKVMDLK